MLYMNSYGMNTPTSYLQNNFLLGESGDKLSVNKDSDYYQRTANRIINMATTELGNLRVIKEPNIKTSTGTFSDIQQVLNTQYDFMIVITKTKIVTIKKETYKFIAEVNGINFDRKYNRATFIENFLLVPQKNGTRKDYELTSAGLIGVNTDFRNSIRKPIKNKSSVKVDIYQVRNIELTSATASKRPYKVSTTSLQEFKVVDGKLKFKYDKDLKITRIYLSYQSDMVNINKIPNIVENDYYVVFYPVETFDGGEFYLGNSKISFSSKKSDVSGSYYENVSIKGVIGKTGLLTYGTMFETFQDDFYVATEYQNRMVTSDGEYIYFSKIGDYNYFLNGTESDDAFYIKLSTIDDEKAKILSIISGRGLWIVTNKGVFLVGYNQVISGTGVEVRFIGTDRCSNEAVDINNTLFYLTTKNELKAVQNTTGIKGYVDFEINTVDKFNSTKLIDTLGEFVLDNKKLLFTSLTSFSPNNFNANVGAFLFKEEDINVFSRVSIEYPLGAIPNYDIIFVDSNNILEQGENNVEKAYVELNVPPTYSKVNGYLTNDSSSAYSQVVLKFVVDTNEDINGIVLNDINSNMLGDDSNGVYSVFKFSSLNGKTLSERVKLTLETTENTSDVELQATEIFYKIGQY